MKPQFDEHTKGELVRLLSPMSEDQLLEVRCFATLLAQWKKMTHRPSPTVPPGNRSD